PDVRAETTVLLRIVPELVVQARREAAIAALRCVVTGDGRSLSVGQAVRAAELAAELDPVSALTAARAALASSDLASEKRPRLEQLAAEFEPRVAAAPSPRPPATPAALRRGRAPDRQMRRDAHPP